MAEHDASDILAIYGAGSVDIDVLENRLPDAWARALGDEQTRVELAGLFGVAPEALDERATPPFRLRPDRAAIDINSVAITVLIWVGSDVFLGALTAMARDEVKRRLERVWVLLEPKLRDVFDVRALGPRQQVNQDPPGRADD